MLLSLFVAGGVLCAFLDVLWKCDFRGWCRESSGCEVWRRSEFVAGTVLCVCVCVCQTCGHVNFRGRHRES